MNTRRKFYFPTILLLLISLWAFALAEDKQELLIDSSRNADFKFTTGGPAEGISGTADLQADFKQALLSAKGDLKFGPEIQKDLNGGQGALYFNATNALMELVGNMDLALPPSPQMPKKLTAKLESVFSDSNNKSYAQGNLDLEAPSENPVPKMDFKGNLEASGQAVSGKLDFTVDLKESAAQMPFKEFNINIAEKDTSSNITVSVSMDGKSPAADNLRQMGKNPDAIKSAITQNLAAAKITVEKVEMGEFKDTPEAVSGSLSILIKDWRGTVKQQLDQASKAQPKNEDAQQMMSAITQMIEMKIDALNVKLTIDGSNLKGALDGGFSNTQGFLMGYADMASSIMKAAQTEIDDETPDFAKQFAAALNQVQAEELKKVVKIIVDSGAKLKFEGDLAVDSTPPAGKTPSADKSKGEDASPGFTAKGNFTLNVDNYKAYVEKALAAGLPIGKSQALLFDVNMTDDQHLKGNLFATTDGKLVDYYKSLALATLAKMKGMEKVSEVVKSIDLKSGGLSVNLNKDGVTWAGFSEASDLSGLAKEGMTMIAKESGQPLSGAPLGLSVDFKAADNKGNATIDAYFADFMKGKSDAEVKKVMGGDVTVNAKATPEQTKLLAVTKPEVKVPETLVALEKEGQAKLSAPAMAMPGSGGGGSSSSSLPIIGGVAVLVLLGVGIAAGKGKK